MTTLKPPMPQFGGKGRAAHLVWPRIGDVPNVVDPFCASLAMHLLRPHEPRVETFNDKCCYISNFWRAVCADPEAVAHWADWPVNEGDMHPRHKWLVEQYPRIRNGVMGDPMWYDAQVAGWWVWGAGIWIGSGWCAKPEWDGRINGARANRGIHTNDYQQRPNLTKRGQPTLQTYRKRPDLKRGIARGVHRRWQQLPMIGGSRGASGNGIHRRNLGGSRMGQWQTRPFLSNSGGNGIHCADIRENLLQYIFALKDRLRRARICCGDWKRVLGPSPTTCIGITFVPLDPPYCHSMRDASVYNHEDPNLSREVREWALANGHNPKLRIALFGYEGEHKMPRDWECVAWKANGGYGNQANGRGRSNASRERIWFSPYCLKV